MKNHQHADYKVIPYSKLRRAMAYTLRSAQRTPMIHGLLEIDVTRARQFLREYKIKTGEELSFTAFILSCFARAVDENKVVQACHKGRKQLAVFDEVDVSTLIEREIDGQKQPIVYIVRAANTKTIREIHDEIRTAQSGRVEQAWESFKKFGWMPLTIFKAFWPILWWVLRRYPKAQKKYGGTVGLTSIGMFAKGGAGWGIPIANLTQLTLGGIAQKPGVADGQIAIREYLCVTLSFDHNIIDGAPAARFAERFRELVESGYGLTGQTTLIPGEALPTPAGFN